MSNRDPYTDGPAERGWSAGSIAAAVRRHDPGDRGGLLRHQQ